MMEVKFRFWIPELQKMTFAIRLNELAKLVDFDEYGPIAPMLFTGKQDKNGHDIYQGDYLLVDGHRFVVVVWHIYQAAFDTDFVFDNKPEIKFEGLKNISWGHRTEIVGNVYQTKINATATGK